MIVASQEKLEIHFDYLSFTFPIKCESELMADQIKFIINDLCNMLNFDYELEVYEKRKAFNNYSYEYSIGQHISFRYGGENTKIKIVHEDDNGNEFVEFFESAQFEVKGAGCRELENHCEVNYIELFRYFLIELEGKCKRIDIAIDDTCGDLISLNDVLSYINKGHFTSCWRKTSKSQKIIFGEGTSIYLGSDSSDRLLCIYDKKAERRVRKEEFQGNYFVRYEMRFKAEWAHIVAGFILDHNLEDIGKYSKELLFGMLDLKRPSEDKNISRWPTSFEWLLFLDKVEKTKFSTKGKKINNIDSKMAWRDYSMTRMNLLFDLSEAYMEDKINIYTDPTIARMIHEMEKMVQYTNEKPFDVNDLAAINHYRINHGKKPLSIKDITKYMQDMVKRIEEFKTRYSLPF